MPRPCFLSRRNNMRRTPSLKRWAISASLIVQSADLQRFVASPVFSAEEQLKAIAAILEPARLQRHHRQFHQARGDQAPPVRPARHDPRLQRAERQGQGRDARRRSLSPSRFRPITPPRLKKRCVRFRVARPSRSTSRSIRRSSAASSSSSARAWSTPRSKPNSIRSAHA